VALSPSAMTSQGLSALEFNKAFGSAIEAAKNEAKARITGGKS
jgi:pyrroline-5-carboxylate reductase